MRTWVAVVALGVASAPLARAQGDLPSAESILPRLVAQLRAPFEGKEGLECDPIDKVAREVLQLDRVTRAGAPAWKATFKIPFECRWTESRSHAFGAEASVDPGKRTWLARTRGTAWATTQSNGGLRFDLEDIHVSQRALPMPVPSAKPSPKPSART